MGITNRILRIPRPRTFLYLMTLRTGTELSTLALLLNKISGFYGLLALLTGFSLSPIQLSMYIYSLLALFLTVALARHIRTQSPFECLALAFTFIIDTVVNELYTVLFGWTWFVVVSEHHTNTGAAGSMGTDPEHKNVSSVDVVVGPDQGIPGGKSEVVTAGNANEGGAPSASHGVLQPESISSISVIVALWVVRVYLVLVVMSYARMVLRRHVANVSRTRPEYTSATGKGGNLLENPFAVHFPEGKGWRGRVGRAMIATGERFWLGVDGGEEDRGNEEIGMGRLRRKDTGEAPGVVERERRRRSGTGPPPPPQLQVEHSQFLRVQEGRNGK